MGSKTTKEAYQEYLDMGGTLPKTLYTKVCGVFNEKVMDRLIDHGEVFNMGFRLSTLQVVRRERRHFNVSIDWKASYELKAEMIARGEEPKSKDNPGGKNWLVYRSEEDEDYYVAFYWRKGKVIIPNKKAYRFDATKGPRGKKTKLSQRINTSPHAVFDYDAG
jgi:hypothetical protein